MVRERGKPQVAWAVTLTVAEFLHKHRRDETTDSLGRRALLQAALFPMPDRQMAADGLGDFSFSGWCLMEPLNSSAFV